MSKKIIYALLIFGIAFSSCEKNQIEEEEKSTLVPTGTLLFHLHTYLGENEIEDYGDTVVVAGRKIVLSLAQLYISEIQVVKLDGSVISLPDTILLKTMDEETYAAGKVLVGNYKGIRFKVGLSAANDALSPLLSKDSLALNHPEMWFGSTAQPDGYVFMNVQGSIDTTSDLSGGMSPFIYKIGAVANGIQVNLPEQNFTILENQAEYKHLHMDYNMLFGNIKLDNNSNLSVLNKADNSAEFVQQILANTPSIFQE